MTSVTQRPVHHKLPKHDRHDVKQRGSDHGHRHVAQHKLAVTSQQAGSAVGGAVGGVAQLGTADMQAVLASLLEMLQKLVKLVQQMNVGTVTQAVVPQSSAPVSAPASTIAAQPAPASVGGGGAASVSAPTVSAVSTGAEDSSFEQRVVDLVNAERAAYGLSPLRYNAQLDAAAEAHNSVQVQTRTMAHINIGDGDPGARIRATGFMGAWGENVAVGQNSPDQVVREWMNSPTHRANILNPDFHQIGVSFAQTSDGYSFWTQSFGA